MPPMAHEDSKDFFRNYIEVIFNEGAHDRLAEFVAADAVDHDPLPGTENMPILEGLATFLDMRRQAFPDFKYTIEDVLAEGDKVFGRLTMHGTHTGAFLGIPASGVKAEMKVMTLVRLQDGKVAEHWGRPDMMSLMRQIGAIK
jgi:steroid delta-isomerase-like uncharacterized protein